MASNMSTNKAAKSSIVKPFSSFSLYLRLFSHPETHRNASVIMFVKMFFTAAMALLATAAETNSTSTDLATQVTRVADLTRIAYILHRDIVSVNNDPADRRVTVAILDAIADQALKDQELNNSPATKRATYTEEQQTEIANAYADVSLRVSAQSNAGI